jgi:hypothetical protein
LISAVGSREAGELQALFRAQLVDEFSDIAVTPCD